MLCLDTPCRTTPKKPPCREKVKDKEREKKNQEKEPRDYKEHRGTEFYSLISSPKCII